MCTNHTLVVLALFCNHHSVSCSYNKFDEMVSVCAFVNFLLHLQISLCSAEFNEWVSVCCCACESAGADAATISSYCVSCGMRISEMGTCIKWMGTTRTLTRHVLHQFTQFFLLFFCCDVVVVVMCRVPKRIPKWFLISPVDPLFPLSLHFALCFAPNTI